MAANGRLIRCAAAVAGVMAFGAAAWGDIESTPLGAPAGGFVDGAGGGGGRDPFALGAYLQTVAALAVVLTLAVVGATLFKKISKTRGGLIGGLGPGGPSPSGVLEILGRYPLGGGQTLVLLRFDRRVVLLHQSGGRKNPVMRTISEVCDPDEVASIMMKTRDAEDDRADQSFREAIRRMEQGYDETDPSGSTGGRSAEQHQIDMLVGDTARPAQSGDTSSIRGVLRGWVGAS